MPERKIIALTDEEPWRQYLWEVFSDTSSRPQMVPDSNTALPLFRQGNPDVVFAKASLLTPHLVAALQAHRASSALFRAFQIGMAPSPPVSFTFDAVFEGDPPKLYEFQKHLVEHLPLPDPLKILLVDGGAEWTEIFQDYFHHRIQPSVIVETMASHAELGGQIERRSPHVLVIQAAPRKTSQEFFLKLKGRQGLPPTIVIGDLVSIEYGFEIRSWLKAPMVDWSSRAGTMPEMAALIKKMAYFG